MLEFKSVFLHSGVGSICIRPFQSAESAIGFGRRLQRRDIPSCLEHLEQPKQVAKL
jgi:hypothetical protein